MLVGDLTMDESFVAISCLVLVPKLRGSAAPGAGYLEARDTATTDNANSKDMLLHAK